MYGLLKNFYHFLFKFVHLIFSYTRLYCHFLNPYDIVDTEAAVLRLAKQNDKPRRVQAQWTINSRARRLTHPGAPRVGVHPPAGIVCESDQRVAVRRWTPC